MTPAFLSLSLAVLAYFVADGVTLPVTPLYVAGPLGGDNTSIGIAIGAFSVTALVLRPFAGRLADVRGRRLMIIIGAALFAVGMIGHLAATSIPLLVVMRLILGCGEAFLFVSALAAASDLAPDDRRGEAISLISLSLYLGIAVGPFIGEWILGEDRFAAVWIAAAVLALVAVWLALRMPETLAAADRDAARTAAEDCGRGPAPIIHPGAIMPGLVLLTGAAGMGGFVTFTTRYARDIGLETSWPVFLLFATIVLGIRGFAPWLPDRLGHRRAAYVALTFGGIGLVTIGVWASPLGLFAGAAVFAFGGSFAFPALAALVTDTVPRAERGAALGTFSAFLDLAFGAGPILLGVVADAAGYGRMFIVAATLAGVGLIILRLTRPRERAVIATAG
jgi:MFS family permease